MPYSKSRRRNTAMNSKPYSATEIEWQNEPCFEDKATSSKTGEIDTEEYLAVGDAAKRFIQYMLQEDRVRVLLTNLGLKDVKAISRIQEKVHSCTRTTAKFDLSSQEEVDKQNLLVDITVGQLSMDQVYEAVYGIGKDCRLRIILFADQPQHRFEPEWYAQIAKNMISNLNKFQMGIWLVKVKSSSHGYEYETLIKPEVASIFEKTECPSKEKFMEAEFWDIYFGPEDERHGMPLLNDFESTKKYGQWVWDKGIVMEAHWTEKGAIFSIKDQETDASLLWSLWNRKAQEIAERFRDCEVKYSVVPGGLPSIAVQVWNNPITDLIGASTWEKKAYGDLLYAKFWSFREIMESYLMDIKEISK
jgi:hypothetical protein